MKTIRSAERQVEQLWGHPTPKNTKYRLMKYLIKLETDSGILLHNNVTGHLVLLDNEETEFLKKIPDVPAESIKELIANHFLVPEDFNEYKSVKQLRAIYHKRNTGDAINHFIILPTTHCNAHCFYCYESDFPHVHMTEETGSKLIDYIDTQRKGKDVLLSWFGGEPLVGSNRIDQISAGLSKKGVKFSSTMISNGYLFNEAIVKKSVELWNLKRVQITLDGTEAVYNKVKAYVNAKENPYKRVLNNIDLLSRNKIQVNIRLNIDFYNKDDIKDLIEELGQRFSGNKFVSVYLNMLFNDQGFEPIHRSEDDSVELLRIIDDYTRRLKELELSHARFDIPVLQVSQCMADNSHAVEIQPDGGFCRCEHESISDQYGNLDDGIIDHEKINKWKEIIEKTEECPECCLYPACYKLRYCMNADSPCIDKVRHRYIEGYKKQLELVIRNSKEGIKNESV